MTTSAAKLFNSFRDTHQLLGQLSERQKEALAQAAVVRRFDARQVVATLGGPVDGVHFLIEGCMRLESLTESGERFLVGDLQSGDVFGLLAVLDGQPSVHHTVAHGDTLSVFIPAQRFRNVIFSDPDMMRETIKIMCQRLRMSLVMVTRFAPGSQSMRVVRCLVALADQSGHADKPGRHLYLNINQFDIAAMLSISRQSVNRVLKELEADGLIKIGYNQIEVLDLVQLREMQ